MPGTVKSKNSKGFSPAWIRELETNRLVPDPISVVMPPSTAAKLSPIITLLTGLSNCSASTCMMGMKITTTGMLLRKALTTRTVTTAAAMESPACPPVNRSINRAPVSSIPVRTIPWPMTNNANTVISAGLAKPARSRSGVSVLAPSRPTG